MSLTKITTDGEFRYIWSYTEDPASRKVHRRGGRYDSGGTFQRCNRYSRRRGNCADGAKIEGDNENYYNGDWGSSDYLGDQRLSQVNFAERDSNYPPIEIEFEATDGWNADIEIVNYLVNRRLADDYRVSERSGAFGVSKLFAGGDSARRCKGDNERETKRYGSHFGKYENMIESSRKKRFRNNDRRNVVDERHAEMDEESGVYPTGDYDHRMSGMPRGGKFARFRCGNTPRFRKDFAAYLENRGGGDNENRKRK